MQALLDANEIKVVDFLLVVHPQHYFKQKKSASA
jgi:hypothetical protein